PEHPTARSLGEQFGPFAPGTPTEDKLAIRKGTELLKEKRDLELQALQQTNPAAALGELRKRIRTADSALKLSPEAFAHLGVGSRESIVNQRLRDQIQFRQLAMQFDLPAVRDSLAAIGGGSANTSAITPITSILDK